MKRTALIDEQRVRDRLISLIRTPSVTGDEEDVINKVATWLQDCDTEVDYWYEGIAALQRDPRYPGHEVERAWVPVVAAVVRGERPGPSVMLTGHVDVVPPGDYTQWNAEPFSGQVNGDHVYGCGAADMKSGIVAALETFEAFATRPRNFAGRVIFVAVPAEEDSGLGTLSAIRRGWKADAAIIPEPTVADGLPAIVPAHSGAISLTIEVKGVAAHASKRLSGESALEHFLTIHRAIRRDEEAINNAESHPLMKQLHLPYPTNVGIISGGTWSSSVMDSLQAEVRIGVPLNETVHDAIERFRRAVMEGIQDDPWLSKNPPTITPKAAGFGSSQIPENHPLVTALAEASEHIFDRRPPLAGAPYGCDMSGWIRLAGVPSVIYGPGEIEWAHSADERASLDLTARVARTLTRATEELLETSPDELKLPVEANPSTTAGSHPDPRANGE